MDLATRLPDYKINIETKIRSFQLPSTGPFKRLSEDGGASRSRLSTAATRPPYPKPPASQDLPLPFPPAQHPRSRCKWLETSRANPFQLLQVILSPLLGPLGTAGLVILLVIFMLLKREDLRSRLIRLIGQGRISATTRAMEDAGQRVSRYLLMQLLVNVTFGVAVAVGLFFIGMPNAILWGAFATVLRFIPCIGPWIAAAFPIVLSLAVSPSWMMPATHPRAFRFA